MTVPTRKFATRCAFRDVTSSETVRKPSFDFQINNSKNTGHVRPTKVVSTLGYGAISKMFSAP